LASQTNSPHRDEPRSFLPRIETDSQPFAARLITERQLQCLAWVQEGKSATDIGGILGLSGRTVEKHIIKICGHLGVKTRVQAVVRARELGLIMGTAP
jgi:ATP/maltotriose-dependent transcriptional regulator MalT